MSILVTGGAGFIGSHLVDRLVRDDRGPIVVLDRFTSEYGAERLHRNAARWRDLPQVTLIAGDCGDADLVRRVLHEHSVQEIVHLAGSPGVRESVANPRPYFENNVLHTLTLLEEVRRHPVRRFLYASSSTVYGSGAAVPFVEDQPLGVPRSPYGVSKRAAELLCETYHGLHGIPATSLRLFNVYGPRLRPELALSVFTRSIDRGLPLPLFGDGSVQRDFCHVNDIVAGMLAALDAPQIAGTAINLGHQRPIAVRRVIELVEEALGKRALIDQRPPREEEMPLTCADVTKAGRLLGYRPQVEIEDGVIDFVRWWREEGECE